MAFKFLALSLSLVTVTVPVFAQQSRPVPYPITPPPTFELAVQDGTRSIDGQPGPNYWQNRADYTIRATLSPETNMVRGSQTIRYYNNSPDALNVLFVHLRQNLHREGAMRNRPVQITEGMVLSNVEVDGQPFVERASSRRGGYSVNGTIMRVGLAAPLPPGGNVDLDMSWAFEIPEAGRAPRMGQDGVVYFLAYWYPQMAVYDDVNGWVADQYLANGEFYMGYGDYDVSITLPDGWLVGATGRLENASDVLSSQSYDRLVRARGSSEVVSIVDGLGLGAGSATRDSPTGVLTWKFSAENVRDFAFGASANYAWDAVSANSGDRDGDGAEDRAVIHALYRPELSTWRRAAEFGKFSIEHLSQLIMPYPYPQMTVAEGIIGGGMEFPMITIIGGSRTDQTLFSVTHHEIGHMWFPMVVGQNEKAYTWMDEGLTSFNTNEAMRDFWQTDSWKPQLQSYYFIAGSGNEIEPMRHGDYFPTNTSAWGIASYNKPAVALHALRGIVGNDRFLAAYREYARRWAFKHPQPFDLFNTFNSVLGEDYNWFWRTMMYETWTLDHAIGEVAHGGGEPVVVTVNDVGLSPFPVDVEVTYEDGSTQRRRVPVSVWLAGNRSTTLSFDPGTVISVVLDPDEFLPDINRSNNIWSSSRTSLD